MELAKSESRGCSLLRLQEPKKTRSCPVGRWEALGGHRPTVTIWLEKRNRADSGGKVTSDQLT